MATTVVVALVPFADFVAKGHECGGGYPSQWCNAAINTVVDNWGMYNRQCVSYTAFRVAASGRAMPYGFGDANDWPDKARTLGIPVDAHPKVGDVAIRYNAAHGHSMYVESLNNDQTITVSQYNVNKLGVYSRERIPSDGLTFIHF